MLAMDFPTTFQGHDVLMLLASWVTHFDNGKRMSNLVRSADLNEAVSACIYYDEITPDIRWNESVNYYEVRRRTV